MKIKRFVSASMAALMALSVSAGAADVTDISEAQTFEYTGSVSTGTIKLTMANSGQVYVNPYGIAVDIVAASGGGAATTSTKQVISPTQWIKNESNTGLKIAVTPTVTAGQNAPVVNATTLAANKAADAPVKSMTLNFDVVSHTDDSTDPGDAGWASAASIDLSDESKVGVINDTGVVMAKKDATTTATYAAFRLSGDAVAEPMNDDGTPNLWTADDAVNVSLAFTFIPSNGAGGTNPSPSNTDITAGSSLTSATLSGVATITGIANSNFDFGSGLDSSKWTMGTITCTSANSSSCTISGNTLVYMAAGSYDMSVTFSGSDATGDNSGTKTVTWTCVVA